MTIDFHEWDKQLENGNITNWPAPINIQKQEATEDELYELYIKNKKYPIGYPLTEYNKQKFVEYNFEFRSIYEDAHSANWMFDNFSEDVKRIVFPWIYDVKDVEL